MGGLEGRQGCGTGGGKIQMGVLVKGITKIICRERQEGRRGCGTGGGKIQMGSSTAERKNTKIIWGARGKTGVWHMGMGDAATSSPGRFSLALEVGWVKALASASHMITKHPGFVGLLN